MNISVVIPTWNGRRLLQAYLPSVLAACRAYEAAGRGATELVVVEDGGPDDTVAWLGSRYPNQVRLTVHRKNRGFAAACHTCFIEARHPAVLLLNNDVRLEPDCLAPMAEHFQNQALFAVTGKMFNQRGDIFCNGGKVARFRRGMWSTYENYDLIPGMRPERPLISFSAIGAFSMYHRDRFLALGGFEPLTAMVEDVDLSYRAWKRGWTVEYEPRSVAYHDASQTMDRRYRRLTLDRISRRSRILMHWMLLHDRSMLWRHALSVGGRLLVSWLALDWRFYWAVASGLANLPRILEKRREARRTMVRTDRELLALLEQFYRTAPIALRRA